MTDEQTKPVVFGVARKFISAIILFSTLLTLIATCLQLYVDYRKDLKGLKQQLSYLETSHRQSLINDIWLFNEPGIDTQLKGILALPMIEAVRLERQGSPELLVGNQTARHPIYHRIPLAIEHRGKTIQLGTLQITASADGIYTRLQERALLILATQFVQVFFIAAFIYVLFHSLIGRHLAVMAHHAAAVTISTLDKPLILHRSRPEPSSQDELDLLVDALNRMQAQISEYLQERRQIEDTLHEQATQLEDEIAQRQGTQEELNAINTNLEERISTAIAELRQKDNLLLQQNRLAAMGELLQNIAHQWRQPLNNIAVYIQGMQYLHRAGELSQEEMDRDIAAVLEILQSISRTIDDFRELFSKDPVKREFVLQEVVEKTLGLTRSTFEEKNITVTVTAETDVRAFGYPNEYSQTLTNILCNARDALLERHVQHPCITITITREANRSLLIIQDNAGGIPHQILPHIFEPYVSTKGPSQGTGIGLYMAKTMIERNMGGTLTGRNAADGAEFRITL